MALLVAILLALFVVPRPWGWALVALAAVYEAASSWWAWRWSRTRPRVVGPAGLVGAAAEVTAACRPDGWVKVQGELWQARCAAGADPGSRVTVSAVEGFVLVVERR
jgi:membrane protein implicated in regulation of membrane protease activity